MPEEEILAVTHDAGWQAVDGDYWTTNFVAEKSYATYLDEYIWAQMLADGSLSSESEAPTMSGDWADWAEAVKAITVQGMSGQSQSDVIIGADHREHQKSEAQLQLRDEATAKFLSDVAERRAYLAGISSADEFAPGTAAHDIIAGMSEADRMMALTDTNHTGLRGADFDMMSVADTPELQMRPEEQPRRRIPVASGRVVKNHPQGGQIIMEDGSTVNFMWALAQNRAQNISLDTAVSELSDNELLEKYIYAENYMHPRNSTFADTFRTVTDEDRLVYDTLRQECLARGYTEGQLSRENDRYITTLLESNIYELTGEKLNLVMLSAMNDTTPQLVAKYLLMSDSEKQLVPQMKDVLTGETLGATGQGRWDKAYSHDVPLMDKADTGWTYCPDPNEPTEVCPIELVTILNEGQASQCAIGRFEMNGKTYMACQSDYLGNFVYDPDEYAIGYKEIPGTESENEDGLPSKLPVLKYVGDLEHDVAHSGKSVLSNILDGENVGEALMNAGPNGAFVHFVDSIFGDGKDGATYSQQVVIPYGVKNIDYTFEDNDELQLIPGIPDSVESMHCTFMNCSRLYEGSWEFKDEDNNWSLPSGLKDGSYTFFGCSELYSDRLGKFPTSLVTIQGMFGGCAKVQEDIDLFHDWTIDPDYFHSTVEADWSDSPLLLEEFANPTDADTSNAMKKVYIKEERERAAFQYEFSKPEHLQELAESDPELLEQWQDAKAANAAERTETVLNGDMTVRSIDEIPYDEPEADTLKVLLQRGVIDVASFAAIGGVTRLVTGSKGASIAAGLGGTVALRLFQVLPTSIEPALNAIKNILPEGSQEGFQKFIDWIHIPSEEEYAAAKRKQLELYRDIALDDSMARSAWSADVFYDDEKIYEAMRVNGNAVADYGVLQTVGEDGRLASGAVKETLIPVLDTAERVFQNRMEASQDGVTDDGIDWNDEMRRYYWQMLYGLQGYNEGAQEGINELYGLGDGSAEDSENRKRAEEGLAYVNCDYADTVMKSLMEMNDKYHFMREEDWKKLDTLSIAGIENLSGYTEGAFAQPVGTIYNFVSLFHHGDSLDVVMRDEIDIMSQEPLVTDTQDVLADDSAQEPAPENGHDTSAEKTTASVPTARSTRQLPDLSGIQGYDTELVLES